MDAPQALPRTVDVAYEREISHPDADPHAARVEQIRARIRATHG
jgi:hypothetical protein